MSVLLYCPISRLGVCCGPSCTAAEAEVKDLTVLSGSQDWLDRITHNLHVKRHLCTSPVYLAGSLAVSFNPRFTLMRLLM